MSGNVQDDLHKRMISVEDAIRRIEERLDRIEGAPIAAPLRVAEERPPSASETPVAALVGRGVLIVGGAYVLRALTERHLINETTGAILGLLYALLWIYAGERAMRRGFAARAMVDIATAAVIASALLWEATSRFHILPLEMASVAAAAFALAVAIVAKRHASQPVSVIAAMMCCITSIGLAITNADAVAPLAALSAFGVISSYFGWPVHVRWIVSGAADTLAIAVIALSSFREPQPGAIWALIVFAAMWLIPREPVQSVVAAVLGMGGAALIAGLHSQETRAVAIAGLVIAVSAYALGFVRRSNGLAGAVAVAVVTMLLLTVPATVAVWAAILVLSALAARMIAWSALDLHVLLWAIASFIVGATTVRTSPALAAVFAASIVALFLTDPSWSRTRLILLFIASGSFLGVALIATGSPALRTLLIAASAVLLAIVSRVVPEARSVARVLLILGGVKLLVDDLRVGTAAASLVALVIYGVALLVVARMLPRRVM